jgi:thymidylate kinase
MRIKVVGPCASGKSVLAAGLRELGYDACSAAQDHSYVPDMWQRLNPPDVLVYLDLTLETAWQRGRTGDGWDQAYLDEQHCRLQHAREHCDLYLATDGLEADEVLARVVDFLSSAGVSRVHLPGVASS